MKQDDEKGSRVQMPKIIHKHKNPFMMNEITIPDVQYKAGENRE